MTVVDDNFLATSPLRSAKSGAKAGAKAMLMDVAGQRSGFQDAFADAGKKNQPLIAIGDKTRADAKVQLNANVSASADSAAAAITPDTPEISIEAPLKGERAESDSPVLKKLAMPRDSGLDISTTIASDGGADSAAVASEAQASRIKMPRAASSTGLPLPVDALPSDADTAQTLQHDDAAKMAGRLKDSALHEAGRTGATTEAALDVSQAPGGADSGAAPSDVSQLLNLLGAAQTLAAAPADEANTTSAMSEFQALAERAGKAKSDTKDTAPMHSAAEADANAVEKANEAGASSQLFRFARADGKGQAVSMNIAANGDKTVAKTDAAGQAGAKAEAVTVLEARRYLGLAPTGNAASITSQIAGNPEWVNSVQSTAASSETLVQANTGKVLNTLKIQMHPIDLGTVTATLRLKDDQLQVELKVETGDAFRQLSDDQDAMIKALRAQGFAVDQVNVVFNAPDSSGGGSSQQQSQAQQQGQDGREAAGERSAQERGQRSNNGGSQQGREGWTGNEGKSNPSSGIEPGGAGDVYM